MHSVATGLVFVPGAVALLVLLVFTYLYEQNRHNYFRAWQLAWAAYTLHYAAEGGGTFLWPFRDPVSVQLAAAGRHGDLYLGLDPADEGALPAEMVRRGAGGRPGSAGVVGLRAQMATGVFVRERLWCRNICVWNLDSPRRCSIAHSIFTGTLFAGIPWPSGPSRFRWRCGRR